MNNKEILITRRESFSSAHRLYSEEYSLEENKKIYDKCINCHGHNYVLFVTVKGNINPKTGMLMNLNDLKEIMLQYAINKIDHQYLNEDIKEFKHLPPTAENLTWIIWDWLKPHLPNLYEIKLEETENNYTVFRG